MPQLISTTLSPRYHQYYQDDAFTLKIPKREALVSQDSSTNEESTAEEIIKSDEELLDPADEARPHYSSLSSDGSEIKYMKSTPSRWTNKLGVSRSLDLSSSFIEGALSIFRTSRSSNLIKSIAEHDQARKKRARRVK